MLRAWLKEHRGAAAVVLLFAFVIFGQRLLYHDIGIDSETMFTDPEAYMRVWCSTGRFGLVLTKKLLGFAHAVPFAANFIAVMLLWAAVTLFGFLVYKWSCGRVDSRLFYPVFSAVFLSAPILTEQFYFTLQVVEISWAFVCCLFAAWLSAGLAYGRQPSLKESPKELLVLWCSRGIPVVCLLVWAFGTYQAFVVVYVVLALVSYILSFLFTEGDKRPESWFFAGCRQVILFLAGLAGWWFVHKLLCHFFFQELSYTFNMILWKVNPSACVSTIKEEFWQMLTGSIFFYQKLFAPVLVLALSLMVWQAKGQAKGELPCFLLALLLFGASPMLLTLVTGGGFPMRSRIFYPLAEAFVFAYAASFLWQLRTRIIPVCFLILAVFTSWRQAGRSMALQETAHLAFVGDEKLMNRMAVRMEEVAGQELEHVPVVFVGKLAPDLPEDCLRGEVTGHSFFDWDAGWYGSGNHRIFGLAALTGLELQTADDEQKKFAVEYSDSMAPWPAEDSVQLKNGILIVKLSSPEKTANRWWYSGGWHYWMNNFSFSLKSDWKEIDGNWYYFDGDGDMVTGIQEINGKTYQFDLDGKWID